MKGWLFTGRIKVVSVPGMIEKYMPAEFVYKPG